MFYCLGSLDVYTIFGTENSRRWNCKLKALEVQILLSELETQGLGSVYYVRKRKLKDLEVYTIFGTSD